MIFTTIISTSELSSYLSSKNWVILDCRFDLQDFSWGFEQYSKGHIPGAIFADLNRDLASPLQPHTGRHPLPDANVFSEKLLGWGISSTTQVIAYDANSGGFASRAWWLLRLLGHNHAAVLDGGWQKWAAESRPISSTINTHPQHVAATGSFDQSFFVNTDQVLAAINTSTHRIIDVRTGERYRGEFEPIDPVAGHIPGAVNRPIQANLTPEGVFKPAAQLRSEILDMLGNTPTQNTIIYCGSGVTSCHLVLAMEIAGMTGAKIYAGSWSEWIRDPQRPVEK